MGVRVPLRRIVTCLDGRRVPLNREQRADMQGGIPYWGAGGIVDRIDRSLFDEPLVLLGEDGAPFFTPGKDVAYFVDGPIWVNNHIHVLRISKGIDARYVTYALNAVDYGRYISGSTRDKLTQDDMREIEVCLPGVDEQRRIANFLDAETAVIDKLLSLRSRQMDCIAERLKVKAIELTGRTAVNLRPGNSLAVVPLRRVVKSLRTGLTPAGLRTGDANPHENELPWYTPAAIDDMLTVGGADKHIVGSEDFGLPVFDAGSILVVGIGESLGKVGYLKHRATGNQQLTALKVNEKSDAAFIAWQLWAAREEIREWAQFSRVRIVNNETLKEFRIWQPDISAQVRAREELDGLRAHFIQYRRVTNKSIEVVKERRQALITAAVTGQFDVTTARGVDLS